MAEVREGDSGQIPSNCGGLLIARRVSSAEEVDRPDWREESSVMIDLATALPRLLPFAIQWVESMEADVLATGRRLTVSEGAFATAVGVRHAGRVRLKLVMALPQPTHPELRAAADQTGLLGPNMAGVTFGYAIFVKQGCLTNRLLSHELRHVYQYETAGSIAAFLPPYFQQIVTVGYDRAPYELDAQRSERDTP